MYTHTNPDFEQDDTGAVGDIRILRTSFRLLTNGVPGRLWIGGNFSPWKVSCHQQVEFSWEGRLVTGGLVGDWGSLQDMRSLVSPEDVSDIRKGWREIFNPELYLRKSLCGVALEPWLEPWRYTRFSWEGGARENAGDRSCRANSTAHSWWEGSRDTGFCVSGVSGFVF